MNSLKGIFRYLTFGLRTEWIELFFKIKIDVLSHSSLGPKQQEAFYWYLKDAELIVTRHETTLFCQAVESLQKHNRMTAELLWSFLWVNLCFNAPLFTWWANLDCGEYSRETTITLLAQDYGKRNRAIEGVYTSLISTFERTPIGSALRIGDVQKHGGQRIIQKRGGYAFHPVVVVYLLYKYAERHGQYTLNLDALYASPDSPQQILAISTEQLKQTIFALFEPEFLTVTFQGDSAIFALQPQKQSLDVFALLR